MDAPALTPPAISPEQDKSKTMLIDVVGRDRLRDAVEALGRLAAKAAEAETCEEGKKVVMANMRTVLNVLWVNT